jgi:AcrR family transcriptional regulator
MSKSRDPGRAREAILAAARAEFSRRGPAGARVDRIAAAAGLNKRMIYHYFGSKAGLWAALLEAPVMDAPLLAPGSGSLGEGLEAIARRFAAEPDVARLLVWEALDDAAATPSDPVRRGSSSQRVAELAQAQRDGRVRTDIDPAQLALALIAFTLFPVAFPQLTKLIRGDAPAAEFEARRTRFLRQFAALLEPTPAKPRVKLSAAVTRQAE